MLLLLVLALCACSYCFLHYNGWHSILKNNFETSDCTHRSERGRLTAIDGVKYFRHCDEIMKPLVTLVVWRSISCAQRCLPENGRAPCRLEFLKRCRTGCHCPQFRARRSIWMDGWTTTWTDHAISLAQWIWLEKYISLEEYFMLGFDLSKEERVLVGASRTGQSYVSSFFQEKGQKLLGPKITVWPWRKSMLLICLGPNELW